MDILVFFLYKVKNFFVCVDISVMERLTVLSVLLLVMCVGAGTSEATSASPTATPPSHLSRPIEWGNTVIHFSWTHIPHTYTLFHRCPCVLFP